MNFRGEVSICNRYISTKIKFSSSSTQRSRHYSQITLKVAPRTLFGSQVFDAPSPPQVVLVTSDYALEFLDLHPVIEALTVLFLQPKGIEFWVSF